MNFWNNFAARHPAAAKWVREGGLFVIVSNLITVFKYLLLQFLPKAFSSLPVVDFGWPGMDVTLFGETFKWNILGYDAAHGGLPYFCAYMVAMILGECINFPIQRNLVFRSKGNLAKQSGWYILAFCVITCIVNSIIFLHHSSSTASKPPGTGSVSGGLSSFWGIFRVERTVFWKMRRSCSKTLALLCFTVVKSRQSSFGKEKSKGESIYDERLHCGYHRRVPGGDAGRWLCLQQIQ